MFLKLNPSNFDLIYFSKSSRRIEALQISVSEVLALRQFSVKAVHSIVTIGRYKSEKKKISGFLFKS